MIHNSVGRTTICNLLCVAALTSCSSNNNDADANSGSEPSVLPEPIINLDSYQSILQEVVSLINGEPLNDTMQLLTGPVIGLTVFDTELLSESNASLDDVIPDASPLTLFPELESITSNYTCNTGGSVEFTRANSQLIEQLIFTDCIIGQNTFNGLYSNSGGRDTSSAYASELTINDGTVISTLTASRTRNYSRQGGGTREWTAPGDGAVLDIIGETELRVRDYSILATSSPLAENPQLRQVQLADGRQFEVTQNAVRAAINGAFEVVTAPWANGQGLNVQVSLSSNRVYYTSADTAFTPSAQPVQFINPDSTLTVPQTLDDQPRAPFAWRTGSVVISADDGSTLMMVPADAQARTFEVTISDVASPITLQWSAGFEINCTEDTLAECDQY